MAVYTIQDTTLTAIADAIREKTGSTNIIKPTEMADIISELNIIPEERFVFTKNISHMFYYGRWDWFLANYRDKITINDITNLSYTFYQSKTTDIPWEISLKQESQYAGVDMASAFGYMTNLTSIPTIKCNGSKIASLNGVFANCERLVDIPNDFWIDSSLFQTTASLTGMFEGCRRLRHLPVGFINRLTKSQNYYANALYNCGSYCHSLDDIIGINTTDATLTSNGCYNMVYQTYHLKDFTFATNEDGSAVVRKWKGQTMDFSYYVGYGSAGSYFSTATQITNDETYQALKDNPDAWTTSVAYARYNHDSAVRTINSLPDTSAYLATAGGTNTIKFKGNAGSATDGGAINTLTEEEIAVATAKGWTVSLV